MRTAARMGVAAAVVAMGPGLAAAAPGGLAVSPRYSAFVAGPEAMVHGWQASATRTGSGWGWALDGGGYYVDGDALHAVLAGPRYSTRPSRSGVSFFTHFLAGAAFADGDALFVAHPGVGVDFGGQGRTGLRIQTDWPIITAYGVYAGAPRVSAGFVFRPGRR
jgi:hypothetical protein